MKKYMFIDHTADIKFKALGNSLEEAFENSFYALKEIMIENKKVKNKKIKKIKIKAKDLKELLHNFLEEFLFLFDAKNFVVNEIRNIKINEKKLELKCEIIGDNSSNYNISNKIKAVTYNDMEILKKAKFEITVVVDV